MKNLSNSNDILVILVISGIGIMCKFWPRGKNVNANVHKSIKMCVNVVVGDDSFGILAWIYMKSNQKNYWLLWLLLRAIFFHKKIQYKVCVNNCTKKIYRE